MSASESSSATALPPKIAILLADDSLDDAELCLRILNRSSLQFHCDIATTQSEFVSRVGAAQYDVILCDYNIAGWTAIAALDHLRSLRYETSFILVTGTLGDETAVECMRRGIADYVLKDRLQRLPLAITHCLEIKAARDEQQRAIRETEEKCQLLLSTIPAAVFVESAGTCSYVNQAAEEVTGYTREQLLKMKFTDLLHEESRQFLLERTGMQGNRSAVSSRAELKLLTKGREIRWLDIVMIQSPVGAPSDVLITGLDVTERKRSEQSSSTSRDPLTGLPNYARMIEAFDLEAMRTDRTARAFSLIVLQLDGIKPLRAKHGSLVVQQSLCRIARAMRLHSRSLDASFRLGEDEFAFLLPETGPDGAPVLGRRLAARLADASEEPKLILKFGVAAFPRDGKTLDQVLKAARIALNEKVQDSVELAPQTTPRK